MIVKPRSASLVCRYRSVRGGENTADSGRPGAISLIFFNSSLGLTCVLSGGENAGWSFWEGQPIPATGSSAIALQMLDRQGFGSIV